MKSLLLVLSLIIVSFSANAFFDPNPDRVTRYKHHNCELELVRLPIKMDIKTLTSLISKRGYKMSNASELVVTETSNGYEYRNEQVIGIEFSVDFRKYLRDTTEAKSLFDAVIKGMDRFYNVDYVTDMTVSGYGIDQDISFTEKSFKGDKLEDLSEEAKLKKVVRQLKFAPLCQTH